MSPGWHSNASQTAFSVLKRIALTFPVFSLDKFANEILTVFDNSLSDIFRFAIITSMFTAILGTRALVNLIYGGRRVDSLSIGPLPKRDAEEAQV